jgi:hypothetical protein
MRFIRKRVEYPAACGAGSFIAFWCQALLRCLMQKQLDDAVEKINNRPRKCLNYQTPNEPYKACLFALQT